ncbi:hypothetical protein GRJ2_000013100 [Grus japonensis]|uniref:Uncharacterized protein n=1 Tax=Grus japonensis TaxID=30415 RepID=A0ABC9VRU2_GRUJA
MGRRYRLLDGEDGLVKPTWIAAVENSTEEWLALLLRSHVDRRESEAQSACCAQGSHDVLGYGHWQPATLDKHQEMLMHSGYFQLNDGFPGATPDIGVSQEASWTQTASDPTISYANNHWGLLRRT